jgi:hypothetical protein
MDPYSEFCTVEDALDWFTGEALFELHEFEESENE